MPTEVRHILFHPAEVVQAIKGYYRRLERPLPPVPVFDYRVECAGTGQPVSFRITMGPSAGQEGTQQLVTDSAGLMAALILHCRERHIPLPAKAEKGLQRFGDQLCLTATINPKHAKMPAPG